MALREHDLYILIADYLAVRYPHAIYRFDLAADLKLSIGQASRHKRLQKYRGYPDLFVAEPRGGYHGLYLEIKKDGTSIFKKDGTLVANAHIREQFDMLEQLRKRGYLADFAIGFEGCRALIDEYLSK